MKDGGALSISVQRTAAGVAVDIEAPPMVSLARMLAGKTVTEAGQMAGAVYPQSASSEAAAIMAAGEQEIPERLARSMLIEALHEHAIKMLAAWPAAVGICPAPVPAPGTDDPDQLEQSLFGSHGAPTRLDAFEAWLARANTPTAHVIDAVWHHWDARWGRAVLPLWSSDHPLGAVDWAGALIDGAVTDTGVVARVAETDLLREVEARRGRGIVWRLAARVADATLLLDRLRNRNYDGLAVPIRPGIGAALAPSGTLLVEVEQEGGVVSRYQRLSPADFALHPGGLLHKVLGTMPRRSRAPLGVIAALAVESIDPAMPTRLTVPQQAAA